MHIASAFVWSASPDAASPRRKRPPVCCVRQRCEAARAARQPRPVSARAAMLARAASGGGGGGGGSSSTDGRRVGNSVGAGRADRGENGIDGSGGGGNRNNTDALLGDGVREDDVPPPQRRGLVALRDFAATGELAFVPEARLLTAAAARKVLSLDADADVDDTVVLALYLLHERRRGAESTHHEYIAKLFGDADGGTAAPPLVWSDARTEPLRGTSAFDDVTVLRARARDVHAQYGGAERESDFLLAYALVLDRAVCFSSAFGWALVPALDEANHADAPNAEIRVKRTGWLRAQLSAQLAARRAITSGGAVTVSYGAKRAADFLLEHGYIPNAISAQHGADNSGRAAAAAAAAASSPDTGGEDSDDGETKLAFGVSAMDRFHDDKLDILEQQFGENSGAERQSFVLTPSVLYGGGGGGDGGRDGSGANSAAAGGNGSDREDKLQSFQSMVQFLRLVCIGATDAFLLESVFRNDVWEFMSYPVSEQNERLVCESIIAASEAKLEDMQQPQQQSDDDEDDDADPSVSYLCRHERHALEALVAFFVRELNSLDDKEYYQERRLRELDLLRPVDPNTEVVDGDADANARGFDDYAR